MEESRLWDNNFTIAAQYVMSPPIRAAHHRPALKRALATGVLQVGSMCWAQVLTAAVLMVEVAGWYSLAAAGM